MPTSASVNNGGGLGVDAKTSRSRARNGTKRTVAPMATSAKPTSAGPVPGVRKRRRTRARMAHTPAMLARSMQLPHQTRDWQELAELDPLWAIASSPDKRFGGWERDEFLASGERDVAQILARAEELGRPARRETALDFGCGVGRTARALASRFASVVGVDIAPAMIERGRGLNADTDN